MVKSFITEVNCSLETAFTESMEALDEDSIAHVVGMDDNGGLEDGVEQVCAWGWPMEMRNCCCRLWIAWRFRSKLAIFTESESGPDLPIWFRFQNFHSYLRGKLPSQPFSRKHFESDLNRGKLGWGHCWSWGGHGWPWRCRGWCGAGSSLRMGETVGSFRFWISNWKLAIFTDWSHGCKIWIGKFDFRVTLLILAASNYKFCWVCMYVYVSVLASSSALSKLTCNAM